MEFPKLVMSAGEVSGTAVRCVGSAPFTREEEIPPVSCKHRVQICGFCCVTFAQM